MSEGKLKESERSHENKKFNLRDTSGSDSSDEDEMIAQLKEKFHIIGRKGEKCSNFGGSFKDLVS